ncbi:MAG: hypothetical protein JWM85_3345 [Acidimicrobiaceae bacterium]|nr:hypothetical protein [Acidimicrobiaceae bacterium]
MTEQRLRADADRVLLPAIGGLASVASLLVPWSHLGSVNRSGLALAQALQASGLASGGLTRGLVLGLYALPAVASLGLAAALLGRRMEARAFAAITGAAVIALAAIAFDNRVIGPQIGPWLAVLLGGGTLIAAACDKHIFLHAPRTDEEASR